MHKRLIAALTSTVCLRVHFLSDLGQRGVAGDGQAIKIAQFAPLN